jgi:hypothetical protein
MKNTRNKESNLKVIFVQKQFIESPFVKRAMYCKRIKYQILFTTG